MAKRFDRLELKQRLRAVKPVILPSLLLCDFAHLGSEVKAAAATGAAALHLDIMDGNFVPNITYGFPIVEAVRKSTTLPLDVHLMISNPAKYIDDFYAAGADMMTIHIEAVPDPRPVLEQIRAVGATAGLSLNPETPLSAIELALPYCDLILVMSVEPGWGGQKFNPVALEKLATLRDREDVDALLEIDGGISTATIGAAAKAGTELFVTGASIFRSKDYNAAYREMRAAALG
jgi:ribulose-phosphate 3-epimerase